MPSFWSPNPAATSWRDRHGRIDKSLDSDVDVLRAVPFFAGFSDEHLKLIAFSAESRSLPEKLLLFDEGQLLHSAYVIVSGTLRGEHKVKGTDKVVKREIGAGRDPRRAGADPRHARDESVRVETRARVLQIRKADVPRLLQEYPEIALTLRSRHRAQRACSEASRVARSWRCGWLREIDGVLRSAVREAAAPVSAKVAMTGTWSEGRFQERASFSTRHAGRLRREVGRHPDVVEAAAAVVHRPVGRAVAPPGEELFLRRHEMAHQVDPAAGGAGALQALGLRPACGSPRAEAACATRRRSRAARRSGRRPGSSRGVDERRHAAVQLVEEGELVGEFRVDLRVGLVAAGRDVEIVDGDRPAVMLDRRGDVARVLLAAEAAPVDARAAAGARRWRRRDSPSGRGSRCAR